ncbi:hypothetical protein AOC36_10325 [Erysipelothrix larvae]|uniref:Prealbumin-like fold domain-containing protein n=1 Tax=Erysipelothrix larvae TaxID=1514105 RepID=A0A109UHJ3_9FIRM|nr:hypothetical protein [Erysipelothrix larvae]AMC94352.1 hypothetical protein AOC36_10325 [Erysipelothrix larvae]
MKHKLIKGFMLLSLSIFMLINGSAVKAQTSVSLTVHHVDEYGAPIANEETYNGLSGDTVTLKRS